MKAYKKLNQTAFMQSGFFTARQAESFGYARSNHHYHIKTGHDLGLIFGQFSKNNAMR